MRSMFSGVSGLKVHQTRMDVIGNNIANVNTVGYKSQRVTFSDVFSQTLSSATAANDDTGKGGMNAMQVGLGVNVSSIDMLMTQGAAQRTDNPFDVMINGKGFMVVQDASGRYFTRAGALRLDEKGNLINANGMKVQGWPATKNTDGTYVTNKQEVQGINLFTEDVKSAVPKATTKAKLSGNIDAATKNGDTVETSVGFYDSLGNYFTAVVKLTKDTSSGVKYTPTITQITDEKGRLLTAGTSTPVTALQPTLDPASSSIEFDANGKLKTALKMNITLTDPTNYGVAAKKADGTYDTPTKYEGTIGTIEVDCNGLTQYRSASTVTGKATDGNAAGTLTGYSVGNDGIVTANYSNGSIRSVAQIAVANFDNPEGLEKVGENLYRATTNSGQFDGIGEAGEFSTGVLEMSNVDLSSEFTDMIITQRGFQANSRIITVSDEMLQELTNLKR